MCARAWDRRVAWQLCWKVKEPPYCSRSGCTSFLPAISGAGPTFISCRIFHDGLSDWCEVVPCYSFDLHFSNVNSDIEQLFTSLLVIYVSSLEKCLLGLRFIFWLLFWLHSFAAASRGCSSLRWAGFPLWLQLPRGAGAPGAQASTGAAWGLVLVALRLRQVGSSQTRGQAVSPALAGGFSTTGPPGKSNFTTF